MHRAVQLQTDYPWVIFLHEGSPPCIPASHSPNPAANLVRVFGELGAKPGGKDAFLGLDLKPGDLPSEKRQGKHGSGWPRQTPAVM